MNRLLFIIPSLSKGGAERVLSVLLQYMREFSKDIIIFENKIDYHIEGTLINICEPSTNNLLKKIMIFIKRIKKINKVKRKGYICSVSFLENANLINIFTKKNEKVFISVRNDILETFKKDPFFLTGYKRKILLFVYKLLVKLLYPRADIIIAVSEGVKESLKKIGIPEEKIKVIYNPYPLKEIQELGKEEVEEVFEKNPYIITVGRLTKQKGQWHLLRIFKELKEDFSDLKLVIVGEGELKDYLVGLSQELGLRTFVWDRDILSEDFDVYFLGFQRNPFKYVSRAKLFVFPSLWEGFPNALVEAMACGVCVISSDCRSGPREILAPDTDFRKQTCEPEFADYGILMPVLEENFLSAKELLTKIEKIWLAIIKRMLEDKELREKYAKKSIERAMDFHVDKIIKEWEKILEV